MNRKRKKEQKERKKKEAWSQTSRLKNPEELQLHQNHEQILFFDCSAVLCTMKNVSYVIRNLT
jgi:hypothetical protein